MPQLLELKFHCYQLFVYLENHLLLSIDPSPHLFLAMVMSSVIKRSTNHFKKVMQRWLLAGITS